MQRRRSLFFFNDTATTEIYTLSLHDALPILSNPSAGWTPAAKMPRSRNHMGYVNFGGKIYAIAGQTGTDERSEEHTSELQSRQYLVCRLLLEKKTQHLLYAKFPYWYDNTVHS